MKRIATYLTLILLSLLAVPQAYAWRHVSPYAYCAGDPVNKVDVNGNDAKIIIDGSNITINSTIVLTGSNATQELAEMYKQSIMDQWGKIPSFTADDGTEYSISWNVNVNVDPSIDLDAGDLPERDGQTNYMQVMDKPYMDKNGKEVHSGLSSNGYTGHIRAFGNSEGSLSSTNPMPHEFGHMMGLKDRYYTKQEAARGLGTYGVPHPGWENSMMAMPSGFGVASSYQIGGPINFSITTNKLLFNWANPSSNNWRGTRFGVRVGAPFFHE